MEKLKNMSNIVVILGPDNEGSQIRMKETSQAADRAGGIDLRFVDKEQTFDEVVEQCQGAAVILPQGRYDHLSELAGKVSTLKLIQTFSAGTDWIDKAGLAELDRLAAGGGAFVGA